MSDHGLTYTEAGVDVDAAYQSLRRVADVVQSTHGPGVVGAPGGFGGMFDPRLQGMERPVLVSTIDGVGTKTIVAHMCGQYRGLGVDLVHHCANDLVCQGARPLFFLDYFGCSRLDQPVFEDVVSGAAEACRALGCALIGGETAEMPGVYHPEEIDIVGCMVGVVEYEHRLPRSKPKPGDRLVGIASNGLHTNGYSLARLALFERGGLSVRDLVPGTEQTIGDALLTPHTLYAPAVLEILAEFPGVTGVAHITGGGLPDNLPRAIPGDLQALIVRSTWTPLPIFDLIQQTGGVPQFDMDRTFNLGIGMVLVVDYDDCDAVVRALNERGHHAAEIGKLQAGAHDVQIV